MPFGYRLEQKRLVIDHEDAAVVRLAFEWCVEGVSCAEVAERLNARPVATKAVRRAGGAAPEDTLGKV